MGIFVDESDVFPVSIYYKEFRDENGALIYTDVSNEEIDGWDKLEAYFCQPSVSVFSSILEESTVLNSLNQKPVIRTRILRDMSLLHLMKSWSATCDDAPVPINEQTISTLDLKIANELFLQYIYNVKLDVYLQAIIKDESENENILRRF